MCIHSVRARQTLAVLMAVILVGLSGCGDNAVKLVPVEGVVTVGGKKLAKGSVILHPDETKGNTSLERPRGLIDAEGKYTVSTHLKGGVAPGWYKVAVTAADQPDPNNAYLFKFLVPERYIDQRTSNLTFEVVENAAPGAYDLNLEAK